MQEQISFPEKKEYSVTVENLHFKLLIDIPEFYKAGSDVFVNTMHTHSHIELFVCTLGTIYINTPDGVIQLFANDAAIVPSDYPHNRIINENDSGSEWCGINLAFSKRQLRDSADLYSVFERAFSSKSVITVRNNQHFCNEILGIYKIVPEVKSSLPALRAVTAIAEIADYIIKNDAADIANNTDTIAADTDIGLLYKLNHIINSCFMKDFTNAEIAGMLYISERQLSRISAKHYGMSIRNAIIEKRLAVAELLLLDTDETAEKIGASVGFNSKSGFYRDFRKKFGKTPTEYRKIFKNRI